MIFFLFNKEKKSKQTKDKNNKQHQVIPCNFPLKNKTYYNNKCDKQSGCMVINESIVIHLVYMVR